MVEGEINEVFGDSCGSAAVFVWANPGCVGSLHCNGSRWQRECRALVIDFEGNLQTLKIKKETTEVISFLNSGRGERIRTSDSYVPNVVLYQAELHPAIGSDLSLVSAISLN